MVENYVITLKNFPRAIGDFNEAIRLNPDRSFYLNRGNSFRKAKDYLEAMSDYDEAIRRDPQYSDAIKARESLFREIQAATPHDPQKRSQPQSPPAPQKTLVVSPTKTLTLKRGVEQGWVRQGFSQGRVKTVVVEKVKPRSVPIPDQGAGSQTARPSGVVLRAFSELERIARVPPNAYPAEPAT
jgi:hypothetical protein